MEAAPLSDMANILFVSHIPIAERMTAPAIRSLELSRCVGRSHTVRLAAPEGSDEALASVFDRRRPGSLESLMGDCDVVFSAPLEPRLIGAATRAGRRWIVDLINPDPIEGLEHHRGKSERRRRWIEALRMDRLKFAAMRGSAFVCGNERQRDMWLGVLGCVQRLQDADSVGDRELRNLIDVVPSGVRTDPPVASGGTQLRGSVFAEDARIMLWNGGVWNWLDPATIIEALTVLRERDQRWVLLFNGVALPESGAPSGRTMRDALQAIERCGYGPGVVRVNETWTPYNKQGDVLLEADVGVSAHPRSLEARFAFRNRLLDFVWGRLPMVCTAGDELADEVETQGWGEVVPVADAGAFAAAVARVGATNREAYRPALDAAAEKYSWLRSADTLSRLVSTCTRPAFSLRTALGSTMFAARYSTAAMAREVKRSLT